MGWENGSMKRYRWYLLGAALGVYPGHYIAGDWALAIAGAISAALMLIALDRIVMGAGS